MSFGDMVGVISNILSKSDRMCNSEWFMHLGNVPSGKFHHQWAATDQGKSRLVVYLRRHWDNADTKHYKMNGICLLFVKL